jgi:hypothetical protein
MDKKYVQNGNTCTSSPDIKNQMTTKKITLTISAVLTISLILLAFFAFSSQVNEQFNAFPDSTTLFPEEDSPKPSPTPHKTPFPSTSPEKLIEARQNFGDAASAPPLPQKFPPRIGEEIYGLNPGQLSCSVGAYVTKNNKNFLLTAEHCGEGVFYGKTKKRLGKTIKTFPKEGLQTIRLSPTKNLPKKSVKHYNTEIPIVGVIEPKLGKRVCRTGAQSGTICNLIVTNTKINNIEIINEDERKNNLVELSIEPNYEKYATGLGDSGGIAYQVNEKNEALLLGVMIGGGGEETKCNVSAGICFTKTYIYPIKEFLENNKYELPSQD